MQEFFPFRGVRFRAREPLQELVTQPYDKISEAMKAAYLKRHPHNFVRIVKNENYQEVRDLLDGWIEEGTLVQDDRPSLYPYQQIFEFEGRRYSRFGLIGLTSLEKAAARVKGHERILNEPLQDRLRLIRCAEANPELIFMLFSDAELTVDRLLEEIRERQPPLASLQDEYGATHRLWKLDDDALQGMIVRQLKGRDFYIADGHHRFQTSQVYLQECREKGWKPAEVESFDKRMVALFNMKAPGLKILPTHRAVCNVPSYDLEHLLKGCEEFFEIETSSSLQDLFHAMKRPGHNLGLVSGEAPEIRVLRLREEALEHPGFMPAINGPARQLDVNLLHEGILAPLLGIGEQELAGQKHVEYFRERELLFQEVKSGRYPLAFFLNPTTLEQVRRLSDRGEKMPQKSTDFFPKLLSGLVLMKMQIEKP